MSSCRDTVCCTRLRWLECLSTDKASNSVRIQFLISVSGIDAKSEAKLKRLPLFKEDRQAYAMAFLACSFDKVLVATRLGQRHPSGLLRRSKFWLGLTTL
jgi:hypothetical protein